MTGARSADLAALHAEIRAWGARLAPVARECELLREEQARLTLRVVAVEELLREDRAPVFARLDAVDLEARGLRERLAAVEGEARKLRGELGPPSMVRSILNYSRAATVPEPGGQR